ncbi:MAG: ATP-dependent 6-phosphofructokinase, partial [Elusimicrobia bacterium]|nr:ATP-dependent 6-phosphofructokinase [Elusimicrobiota bacterium]
MARRGALRIAISTGGGDAPGLNAVIRAVVRSADRLGWTVFGIRRGYDGLIAGDGLVELGRDQVRGLIGQGGTILGTTNRGNPFRYPVRLGSRLVERDLSARLVRNFRRARLDAIVAAGGDGSLGIAAKLWRLGVPIVGVPKTIDNDLEGTVITFGFDTAVTTATDAVDKLHSTAASHERTFVVEVMGRNAGWIAMHSGIAGGADAILIPEIPFRIERVCARVRARYRAGRRFAIIVAAEGAAPLGGVQALAAGAAPGREARLGGVAEAVARAVAKRTGVDTRSL